MPGKIISMINFKGGVGKTTLAVNIAASVAKYHQKKTLLIDLDPQSNSSTWLMGIGAWEEIAKWENLHKTAVHLFTGSFNKDMLIQPYANALGESIPNLFLLPATFHMVGLERAITRWADDRKRDLKYKAGDEYTRLSDDKAVLKEAFDFIFIDCPPNLYQAAGNAVVNSDFLLVPVIPDTLSIIGLRLLITELTKLVKPFESKSGWVAPALLGVVLSKVRPRITEHETNKNSVIDTIERLKNQAVNGTGLLRDFTRVYHENPIREYVAHSQATQKHVPICLYKEGSDAERDVKSLTDTILKNMESADV